MQDDHISVSLDFIATCIVVCNNSRTQWWCQGFLQSCFIQHIVCSPTFYQHKKSLDQQTTLAGISTCAFSHLFTPFFFSSSDTVIKCCLPRGGHLPFRILRHKILLGANQTGRRPANFNPGIFKPRRAFSLTDSHLVSPSDNPQDNVRQPSRHHARVEAESRPGRHRESQRRETGQKHLLAVQDPTQQLPRGLCCILTPGEPSHLHPTVS